MPEAWLRSRRVFRFRPRCYVHPDRYGTYKPGLNRLLVVHTSESGEGYSGAENLCSFMGTPGDRIDPITGHRFGASYHYVTDTDESLIPATADNRVAFAAAGANNTGIHFCIPGHANQTRTQWLDADSTAHLHSLAWGMQRKAAEFSIPLRRLTVDQVRAGATGYCGHVDVSLAFGRSDHNDPGPGFPWALLGSLLVPDTPPPDPLPGGSLVAERLKLKSYRLYDSREQDGKLHGQRQLGVTDPDAAGAVALLANITVTDTEGGAAQFLSAWDGGAPPGTSKLNWDGPGQTVANEVTVPFGGFGTFQVTTSAPTHLIVDIVGYWMP